MINEYQGRSNSKHRRREMYTLYVKFTWYEKLCINITYIIKKWHSWMILDFTTDKYKTERWWWVFNLMTSTVPSATTRRTRSFCCPNSTVCPTKSFSVPATFPVRTLNADLKKSVIFTRKKSFLRLFLFRDDVNVNLFTDRTRLFWNDKINKI